MGGGGAMRAAAKVAGIGVVSTGLRGSGGVTAMLPSTEQSMMRGAGRPVSASLASASQADIDDVLVVQRPAWETDDWEFAGGEEDLVAVGSGGGEPMARLVFGGPPSLEEAKDATSELKEAIDKVLLPSSKSYASDGMYEAIPTLGLSLLSDASSAESKTCILYETRTSPVPKVAMQAFAFLSESPAAQSVVASVASDPNVWDAVMKNEALVEFLKSSEKSSAKLDDAESLKEDVESSDDNPSEDCKKTGGSLMDIVEDIKVKVVQMVSNVSGFIHDMFGSTSADKTDHATDDGKARPMFFNEMGTFLALAVMVVMVVVLKRA